MTLGFNSQLTYFQEIEQLALSGCRGGCSKQLPRPSPNTAPSPLSGLLRGLLLIGGIYYVNKRVATKDEFQVTWRVYEGAVSWSPLRIWVFRWRLSPPARQQPHTLWHLMAAAPAVYVGWNTRPQTSVAPKHRDEGEKSMQPLVGAVPRQKTGIAPLFFSSELTGDSDIV